MAARLLFAISCILLVAFTVPSCSAIEFDSSVTTSDNTDTPAANAPPKEFVPPVGFGSKETTVADPDVEATTNNAVIPSTPSSASEPSTQLPAPPVTHIPRLLTGPFLESIDGKPDDVDAMWTRGAHGESLPAPLLEARLALRTALAGEILAATRQELSRAGLEEPYVGDLPDDSRQDSRVQSELRKILDSKRIEYRTERIKQFHALDDSYAQTLERELEASKEVKRELAEELAAEGSSQAAVSNPVSAESTNESPASTITLPSKSSRAAAKESFRSQRREHFAKKKADRLKEEAAENVRSQGGMRRGSAAGSNSAKDTESQLRERFLSLREKRMQRDAKGSGSKAKGPAWKEQESDAEFSEDPSFPFPSPSDAAARAKSPFGSFISKQLESKERARQERQERARMRQESQRGNHPPPMHKNLGARGPESDVSSQSDSDSPSDSPPNGPPGQQRRGNGPPSPKDRRAQRMTERQTQREKRQQKDQERKEKRQAEIQQWKEKTEARKKQMMEKVQAKHTQAVNAAPPSSLTTHVPGANAAPAAPVAQPAPAEFDPAAAAPAVPNSPAAATQSSR